MKVNADFDLFSLESIQLPKYKQVTVFCNIHFWKKWMFYDA